MVSYRIKEQEFCRPFTFCFKILLTTANAGEREEKNLLGVATPRGTDRQEIPTAGVTSAAAESLGKGQRK